MLRARVAWLAAVAGLAAGTVTAAEPDARQATGGLGPEEQAAFAKVRWEADPDFAAGGVPPDAGFFDGEGASTAAPIPEPGTLSLLGIGLAALALKRRRPGPR